MFVLCLSQFYSFGRFSINRTRYHEEIFIIQNCRLILIIIYTFTTFLMKYIVHGSKNQNDSKIKVTLERISKRMGDISGLSYRQPKHDQGSLKWVKGSLIEVGQRVAH